MDLPHILFLIGAGIVGGIMSAVAGGAAMFTFPALLAAGVNPILATAANMVALTPGNFFAAFYDRSRAPPLGWPFIGLLLSYVVGAILGAALLVITPMRVFTGLIPLLLAFATVLFGYAHRISGWLRARAAARGDTGPHHWGRTIPWLFPVAVYGGYFGAGVGVLVLGVLMVGTGGDYRSANVAKNIVTSTGMLVASAVFVAQGIVPWSPALVLMMGTLIGALIGARVAQVLPNNAARAMIVIVGALLTAAFAWRYWF